MDEVREGIEQVQNNSKKLLSCFKKVQEGDKKVRKSPFTIESDKIGVYKMTKKRLNYIYH